MMESVSCSSVDCAVESLESELQNLKDKYQENCRVIDNIGEFIHVVTVLLNDWSIKLKFQITAEYPTVKAGLVLSTNVSSCVPEGLESDLYNFLTTNGHGGKSLTETVTQAEHWLQTNGIISTGNIPGAAGKVDKRKKKKSKKATGEAENNGCPSKKSPMKTADDVVKRILWDEQLKPDDFVIGYLDRFLGVLEEDFTTFSWEDLASVDDHVALAIPKHRIQYFKYRGIVVWDKTSWLDNVFGSTGGGVTITDVAQQLGDTAAETGRKWKYVRRDGCENFHNKEDGTEYKVDGSDDTDDDDDDDDIVITLGNDIRNQRNDEMPKRIRPTHFVCQRITDPDIIRGVESMQNEILNRAPYFSKCCLRPSTLHMTLCTVGLDSEAEVTTACEALRQSSTELSTLARRGIRFTVSSVDHFFKRVIYGRVERKSDFDEYLAHVRSALTEAGIDIRDSYDFVPHVTILKLSLGLGHEIGCNKVPDWMFEDFKGVHFGSQNVTAVDLCAMSGERVDDFYVTPLHLDLLNTSDDIDFEEEL